MALSTFVPLTPGDSVRVEFSLPDHQALFSAEGTICWCKTGHLGLRFVSLSQKQKAELQGWLSRKLEEMIPDFVAREFQKAEPFQRPPTSVRYHGRALLQNSTDHPAAIVSKPGESDLRARTHRWKRCQLDVPLRVIVCNEDATKIYDGRGNEINDGGMTITAGVELKPGDTVAIEFTPPYGGVPIRVRGTVRNRTGYRYGVEFIIGSIEESSQLDRLRPILQTT
jgi:PilZ domain-containing protein